MVGAQPLVILQLADVGGRHKAAAQQPVRVQGGQPLAVRHVGLAPRNVLHVPPVDHHHLQPGRFQHFIDIEPVDAGGFHRHRMHPLFPEPVAQTLQVAGEGAEDFRGVSGNRDVEFFTADINASSLGIKHGQGFHNTLGCELNQQASRRGPVVIRRTSLPSGNTAPAASPNNAHADDRNQSHPRAVLNYRTHQRRSRSRCAQRLTPLFLSGSGVQSAKFRLGEFSPRHSPRLGGEGRGEGGHVFRWT